MLYFQDPVTDLMEGIIMLHNWVMIYLIFILDSVLYIFGNILYYFYAVKERVDTEISFEFREILTLSNIRQLRHSATAETAWTIAPFILVATIMFPSFVLLYQAEAEEEPEYTVRAVGHQWYWNYERAGYMKYTDLTPEVYELMLEYYADFPPEEVLAETSVTTEEVITYDSNLLADSALKPGQLRLLDVDKPLRLNINAPIRIVVTAADVLHSWAVPAFGIKIDAVPGRLNQVHFILKREGVFYGQCSELCGTGHGFMPISIYSTQVIPGILD